jgi:hypothetical protein
VPLSVIEGLPVAGPGSMVRAGCAGSAVDTPVVEPR